MTRDTAREWHVPADLMGEYVAGDLGPALVMSVEAHLVRCGRCRAAVPYEEEWLEAGWERLEDEVGRPRPGPVERVFLRLGVPDHAARLITATPSLSRAWLSALVLTLASAVGLAQVNALEQHLMLGFLIVAPVLPLAGVALAYGPRVDPAHEMQAATPMAGPRLLLVRAGTVLVTAVALIAATTPLLPGTPGQSVAWLLPALALSTGLLALTARGVPMWAAGALLGAGWLVVASLLSTRAGDAYLAFSPPAQALYGMAALVSALCVYVWRTRFEIGEHRWT